MSKKLNSNNAPNNNDITINYDPLPSSKKVYVSGNLYPDIRVPFREITLSDTHTDTRNEKNPPINVYDCSGIYTDPEQS